MIRGIELVAAGFGLLLGAVGRSIFHENAVNTLLIGGVGLYILFEIFGVFDPPLGTVLRRMASSETAGDDLPADEPGDDRAGVPGNQNPRRERGGGRVERQEVYRTESADIPRAEHPRQPWPPEDLFGDVALPPSNPPPIHESRVHPDDVEAACEILVNARDLEAALKKVRYQLEKKYGDAFDWEAYRLHLLWLTWADRHRPKRKHRHD